MGHIISAKDQSHMGLKHPNTNLYHVSTAGKIICPKPYPTMLQLGESIKLVHVEEKRLPSQNIEKT